MLWLYNITGNYGMAIILFRAPSSTRFFFRYVEEQKWQ
jgi:hypothetical protein